MPSSVDKDRPSPEWIASLRKQFPIEKEIDRILTRRMERRAGPAFSPLSLETLVEGTEALIRRDFKGAFSVTEAKWLSGGASKLQMAFVLDWTPPGGTPQKTRMVLRMEPSESIVETSRLREFQLIKAVGGVVPVPPVFWCDADGSVLPYPALVYGFADGVTKPSASTSGVSGLGTKLPDQVRDQLIPQFIDHLAKIHTFDFSKADLTAFEVPQPGVQCAEWGVNWWERVWDEDSDEDVPLMRVAAGWLRRNLPSLDRPCLVHADFRVGNFLFTEPDSRISAWLDWELGRIGDPHQDLAWICNPAFSTKDEHGAVLVNGLMPENAFFEAYEKASGIKVNAKTLHWYKVYNSYMIVVLALATGYRIAHNGKTHQDVLVTWLLGIGYLLLEDLRSLIEKGN